jgi:hypothetical protein
LVLTSFLAACDGATTLPLGQGCGANERCVGCRVTSFFHSSPFCAPPCNVSQDCDHALCVQLSGETEGPVCVDVASGGLVVPLECTAPKSTVHCEDDHTEIGAFSDQICGTVRMACPGGCVEADATHEAGCWD